MFAVFLDVIKCGWYISTDVLVERVHQRVPPKRWYIFSQLLNDASRKAENPHLQFIERVALSPYRPKQLANTIYNNGGMNENV
jgi:hypothetical protein